MSDIVFIILLVIHIGSVIIWIGLGAAFASVIGAFLSNDDLVRMRPELIMKILRRYSRLIAADSTITILAGFFLFDYVSTVSTRLLPSGWGLLLIYTGAILGLVALIVSLAAILPATNKIAMVLLKGEEQEAGKAVVVRGVQEQGQQIMNSLGTIRAGIIGSTALLVLIMALMIAGTNF